MKLSFRFFCIAYLIVLLAMGTGGTLIILNVTNTLFESRKERVLASADYAAESFLSFCDISYGEIIQSQASEIAGQIKNTLDEAVSEVRIYSAGAEDGETENAFYRFTVKDSGLAMEAVCRLDTAVGAYCLAITSDFSGIKEQNKMFFTVYGITVLSVSLISGALLLVSSKRITKPLSRLSAAAERIASGSYGEKIEINNCAKEIKNLSDSFNSMSAAVERKISEITEEAEKRDIFVADFTHELKTPMTAIMGYAQMLDSYELTDSERGEAARAIYGEARRLENLSLRLLELYVYRDEKAADIRKTELSGVERQLEASLKNLSVKYGAPLRVGFPDTSVMADETLLLSLLYNLADNAFKATENGSEVSVYGEDTGTAVRITVKDSGRGIAQENLKMLTQPFFREDKSRSRKLGGAGLGLSICEAIAKLHGTALDFKSEPGKGTEVSFILKKAVETQ